jgi:hypothetical protein
VGAIAALIHPSLFNWIPTPWITWALAATMLGMGLTMRVGAASYQQLAGAAQNGLTMEMCLQFCQACRSHPAVTASHVAHMFQYEGVCSEKISSYLSPLCVYIPHLPLAMLQHTARCSLTPTYAVHVCILQSYCRCWTSPASSAPSLGCSCLGSRSNTRSCRAWGLPSQGM